jgi:hypothetical protein
MNNTEELGRALHRLSAPATIDSPAGILIVNMVRSIIYLCLPLRTILGVLRNTVAKEITLHAPGEITAGGLDMDIYK